jgi:hypothetical protein
MTWLLNISLLMLIGFAAIGWQASRNGHKKPSESAAHHVKKLERTATAEKHCCPVFQCSEMATGFPDSIFDCSTATDEHPCSDYLMFDHDGRTFDRDGRTPDVIPERSTVAVEHPDTAVERSSIMCELPMWWSNVQKSFSNVRLWWSNIRKLQTNYHFLFNSIKNPFFHS